MVDGIKDIKGIGKVLDSALHRYSKADLARKFVNLSVPSIAAFVGERYGNRYWSLASSLVSFGMVQAVWMAPVLYKAVSLNRQYRKEKQVIVNELDELGKNLANNPLFSHFHLCVNKLLTDLEQREFSKQGKVIKNENSQQQLEHIIMIRKEVVQNAIDINKGSEATLNGICKFWQRKPDEIYDHLKREHSRENAHIYERQHSTVAMSS